MSAFFTGRLFEQWYRIHPQPITKATTTPTPYVAPLPEGGAYVKCLESGDYLVECYVSEQYQKTTQLEGVSMDVFVTKKGMKELEKQGDFEIYYLKQYCGQNLSCYGIDGAVVTKLFINGTGFFQSALRG